MGILNLNDNLPEQGKIKIGGKGAKKTSKGGKEYQLPQKWDYFQITTLERDASGNFIVDEEMTKKLTREGDVSKPKVIGPCIFPFNEIELNFYTTYAYYVKSKRICRGNGEKCLRIDDKDEFKFKELECNPETCKMAQKNLCKPNGILSVIFPEANALGGVYKFRTTSWNSIISIRSQLRMFTVLTGGNIAGVPFNLVLNKKDAMPGGKKQTIYFVTLEYKGGIQSLRDRAPFGLSLPDAATAKKNLMLENAGIMEDPEEFNPEVKEVDGKLLDTEGNIIDKVANNEPEGKGAFADDLGEVPF